MVQKLFQVKGLFCFLVSTQANAWQCLQSCFTEKTRKLWQSQIIQLDGKSNCCNLVFSKDTFHLRLKQDFIGSQILTTIFGKFTAFLYAVAGNLYSKASQVCKKFNEA